LLGAWCKFSTLIFKQTITPVYLHISNLIIKKEAIAEKYNGGLEKFRKDYNIPESEINQEDGSLFSLGKMNPDEFDIEKLLQNGLSFDMTKNFNIQMILQ